MDIETIKREPPEGAKYWSPAVEQYFSSSFINLSSAFKGQFITVAPSERAELIPLY